MRIVMQHDGRRRYWSEIHRDDGVVLLLPGYDRKWRVPHDLGHLATERALRLAGGVFGSIAAGALFDNMTVLSGRLRHDARRRSQRILRENSRDLGISEILSGVVHHAVEKRMHRTVFANARAAWGALREEPFPYQPTEVQTAVDELEAFGRRWAKLDAGQRLTIDWPR